MFERLKSVRKNKGATCAEMANLLGLENKSAYSRKENGSIKFSLQEAKQIADFFDTTIEDIFFSDEVAQYATETQAK